MLAGFLRARSSRSNEAALKYFLLGAFATGFLLYGIALLYGATGTHAARPDRRGARRRAEPRPLLLAGVALLLVGFGFKVAAVPFHMWTPDVYEGAPTPVTAFMAVGVKAAASPRFARVFLHGLGGLHAELDGAALGARGAHHDGRQRRRRSRRRNVKRMLAYSSIAHAGYVLVGARRRGHAGGGGARSSTCSSTRS